MNLVFSKKLDNQLKKSSSGSLSIMFFLNQFENLEFGYLVDKKIPIAIKVIAKHKNSSIQEIM